MDAETLKPWPELRLPYTISHSPAHYGPGRYDESWILNAMAAGYGLRSYPTLKRAQEEAERIFGPPPSVVFTIRLLPSRTQVHVEAACGVEPDAALIAAMEALQDERDALVGRPVHAATRPASPSDVVGVAEAHEAGFAEGVERAGAVQANLVRLNDAYRARVKAAEEAFDLLMPWVAKFAAAVAHYGGGVPSFPGTVTFFTEPEPNSRPALTSVSSGPTGPGCPPDGPTIGDLRRLAEAYWMACDLRMPAALSAHQDARS